MPNVKIGLSLTSLSKMAAIATIVEKKIDDLKEINDPEQLTKDNNIKINFSSAADQTENALPDGLNSLKAFFAKAKSDIESIEIPPEPDTKKYGQKEQEQLYKIADYLSYSFRGLKNVPSALKAIKPNETFDLEKIAGKIAPMFAGQSKAAGQVPSGWNPQGFSEEIAKVAETEEGRKSLIAITSKIPESSPPEQPETSDEEDEETADPFVAFEERSKTDKEIKDNFAKFLNGKVGGPLGTEGFLKMKEIGLLNLDAAKEIMREFLKQYKK